MTKINTKWDGRIFIFLLLFSFLAFFDSSSSTIHSTYAASGSFFEDFTTTAYMDSANTNVSGWGTGVIENSMKKPLIVGAISSTLIANVLDVFVSGDYAYVTNQNFGLNDGLKVVNITDSSKPYIVSTYDTPHLAQSVFVDGDYAFITDWQGLSPQYRNFIILDVSDPTNPTHLGNCTTNFLAGDAAQNVVVAGNTAYVANNDGGLCVIDVTDTSNPSRIGVRDTAGTSTGLAIDGDCAFLADGTNGLVVIDIKNPSAPTIETIFNTKISSADSVLIEGNNAYVIDINNGVIVVDITNPTTPASAGSMSMSGATDAYVHGDYLYVTDITDGLSVLNITDPTTPILLHTISLPGVAQSIAIEGCYAYIACQDGGFQVVQISDYVSPSLISVFDLPSNTRDVAIVGDLAYLADLSNGMTVVNISDPSTPFLIDSYPTLDDVANGIAIEGNFAYVADMTGGLSVFDITDPSAASRVDTYEPGSFTYAVDIAGDFAYLACYANGLRILNISDPSNLIYVSSIHSTSGSVQDVTVAGNYAYLAARSSGLVIYDITNPFAPSYAGIYLTGGAARGVTVVGNLAFVGASGSGMEIIDISNPSSPSFIGSCDTSNNAWAVDVVGDLAFIADYEGGLSIANITDPTDPYIIYSYDTSDQAFSVSVYGDYAYVGDSNGGLLIFECYLNKAEQYASPTISQSTEIYSESTTAIISANLLSKGSIPSDTSLSYYLSSNGGTNWEQVSNDTEHLFTNTGNQLKWRIILETQNISITPSVKALSILYSTKLLSPYLLSPIDGYITDDYTPTFTWSGIDGETNYLFQLDTTTSFTDPPLNFTLPSSITSYTPISPLASDTYYWRVAGIDSEGDIGEFSSYNTLYIIQDTVAPSINHPNDIICELGTIGNNIIWSPMDSNPYWYNITLNSILTSHDDPWTGGSIIMDIDGLPLGTYTVVCSVYDLEGFMTSDTVNIEVVSTAPPTIDDVADFPYEEDSTGNSITWHPSDTNPDYYSVTRDGTVIDDGSWVGGDINIDIDGLAYGVYTFVCTVNDTEGQEASDTAIVSVTDSVNPILNSPSDIIYSEGDTGNNIIWVATDNNPETYIVYKDGTLYEGDTWVSGSSIIVSVDGLTSGSQYNFTIVIVDQVGNAAKDTVIVAVTAAVPEYQMFSVLLATCVILSLASIHARRKKRKDS